jgi:hypothetical protein
MGKTICCANAVMCPPAAGAVQGAYERAALCRAGGLQADEEEGEGDVPTPASPGHLIPTGEFQTQRGSLNLKVHKHEIFVLSFFAETESLWSQGPVTRDF